MEIEIEFDRINIPNFVKCLTLSKNIIGNFTDTNKDWAEKRK